MFQGVSQSLPKTAYLKFIDYWLNFCLIVPFAVFLTETFWELRRARTSGRLRKRKKTIRNQYYINKPFCCKSFDQRTITKAHSDKLCLTCPAASEVCGAENRKFPISVQMQLYATATCVKRRLCESTFNVKYHCTADLQFNFCLYSAALLLLNYHQRNLFG